MISKNTVDNLLKTLTLLIGVGGLIAIIVDILSGGSPVFVIRVIFGTAFGMVAASMFGILNWRRDG